MKLEKIPGGYALYKEKTITVSYTHLTLPTT